MRKLTFIYMDSVEKAIMESVAEEARKRGYETELTTDKFVKCDIGFYCQHVNFPQYSKVSVIMLHDIVQQFGYWPDLWMREPWNKYDIGILPSDQWVKNWNQCSQYFYANPRYGVYKVGWPKADFAANIDKNAYREKFYKEYGLDESKKTVLYAPAWENDGKQDDFVKAMLKLDVNILIKQYPATPTNFPEMYKCIQEMNEKHKDIPGVTILDGKMNIFEAILAADMLVSEESSTLAEAVMMGIPSVSVSDWLIPDTVPSRLPNCNYDFVVKTTKAELSNCVNDILDNYDKYKGEAEGSRERTFCNIGKSASMIMDILEDYLNKKESRYPKLTRNHKKMVSFKKFIKYAGINLNRAVMYNYGVRHKSVMVMWDILRKVKKLFFKTPIEN